jgi:hypothetical protein
MADIKGVKHGHPSTRLDGWLHGHIKGLFGRFNPMSNLSCGPAMDMKGPQVWWHVKLEVLRLVHNA